MAMRETLKHITTLHNQQMSNLSLPPTEGEWEGERVSGSERGGEECEMEQGSSDVLLALLCGLINYQLT